MQVMWWRAEEGGAGGGAGWGDGAVVLNELRVVRVVELAGKVPVVHWRVLWC